MAQTTLTGVQRGAIFLASTLSSSRHRVWAALRAVACGRLRRTPDPATTHKDCAPRRKTGRANWWWPFAVIFAVTGFGYLLGLSTYGVGEEVPADDANDRPQVRFPVTY
jgi:hypothetical protein